MTSRKCNYPFIYLFFFFYQKYKKYILILTRKFRVRILVRHGVFHTLKFSISVCKLQIFCGKNQYYYPDPVIIISRIYWSLKKKRSESHISFYNNIIFYRRNYDNAYFLHYQYCNLFEGECILTQVYTFILSNWITTGAISTFISLL